jgi:hypothetical protein
VEVSGQSGKGQRAVKRYGKSFFFFSCFLLERSHFEGARSLVMRIDRRSRSLFLKFATSIAILCAMALIVFAQTAEETTRRLWDTAFISPAKAHVTSKRTPINKRVGARSYRVVTPTIPTTGVAGDTVVGVTVWRLRRSTAADSGERLIAHEGPDEVAWLPERVAANTKLAEGDRLRISVEAARTGYLYVIDREQYADSTLGEPYMIFPTTRTLGGNNAVSVGKVIEIPAQDDAPPYFTLRRSRPDQVAEVMSVLVTPSPLEGFQITDKAQKLSETEVAAWEKSWSAQVGSLELENGGGRAWTKEEKDAGADPKRLLRSDGPPPQIVYYRPHIKSGEPMFVNVNLRYRVPTGRATR